MNLADEIFETGEPVTRFLDIANTHTLALLMSILFVIALSVVTFRYLIPAIGRLLDIWLRKAENNAAQSASYAKAMDALSDEIPKQTQRLTEVKEDCAAIAAQGLSHSKQLFVEIQTNRKQIEFVDAKVDDVGAMVQKYLDHGNNAEQQNG